MMEIDKIRAALADLNLAAVAAATGIHKNGLYAFRHGRTTLRYDSMVKLVKYLQARESILNG
jgi:hypothetical protein